MTVATLRAVCLGMLGAREERPFPDQGVVTYKVGGKIFAITQPDAEPLTVSLKCEPELVDALRAEHSAIRPGYHLNKRHWNTVTLDGSLPERMIVELIEDSYDLVVEKLPRALRTALRNER